MTDPRLDPTLPPRETLDAWTVPELPDDFADRVVMAWEREARAEPAPARRPATTSRRWIGIGVGALLGAAAAVALMLLARGPTPPPEGVAKDRTAPPPVVRPPRAPEPETPSVAAPNPSDLAPAPASPPQVEPAASPDPPPASPPKPAAKDSTLRIGTEPGVRPATVSVDGKEIGTTPISSLKVTAGKHRVRWRWDDGSEQTKVVSVVAGEALTLKAEP